jgi:broad specificity phosphatase PhoE
MWEKQNEIGMKKIRDFRFPGGGERWKDVYSRLRSFVKEEILKKLLKNENKNKNFLIVTHGGAIMELFNVINVLNDP